MVELFVVAGVVGGIAVVVPLFLKVSRAAKYSYTNARARGMMAKLAPKETVTEYCDYSISAIVTDLESQEGYHDLVRMIGDDFSVENIHHALNRKSWMMNERLLGALPKSDKAFFEHLVAKSDYQNVRVLVRLKMNGKFGMMYRKLVSPTKIFSEDAIEDFLDCSLEDLWVKLRFTRFKEVVEAHFDVKNPATFEHALDRDYYDRLQVLARKTKNRELMQYAKKLVDLHNVSALTAYEQESEIIAGGYLEEQMLWELKAAKPERVAELMAKTYIDGEPQSLQEARVAIERHVHAIGQRLLKADPMSLSSAIGYFIMKEIQISNLKRLLKLKAAGASPDLVRSVVV